MSNNIESYILDTVVKEVEPTVVQRVENWVGSVLHHSKKLQPQDSKSVSTYSENYLGNKILEEAAYRIGEHEEPMGSNLGALPDKANRYAIGHIKEPWCASFASLCIFDAVETIEDKELRSKIIYPRTGSTGSFYTWGHNHDRIIAPTQVQPGDLGLVIDPSSHTGFCHTVIVRARNGSTIFTVEGNHFDKVAFNTREARTMHFIRPYVMP